MRKNMKKLFSVLSVLSLAFFFAVGCLEKKAEVKKPKLDITSAPAGAMVSLLGKERGVTPFHCSLLPSTYIVKLEKPGYRAELIRVEIKQGTDRKIDAKLKPVTASVMLTSVPAAAPVIFQGKKIGETPLVIKDLPYGEYSAELAKSGYTKRTVSWKMNEDGRPVQVKTDLASNVGTLKITSNPAGATVTLNGTVMGRTPFSERIEEGKHNLEIARDGYVTLKQVVTVVRRQETSLKDVKLEIIPSTLKITSTPSGARVFVNDKQYSDTPMELRQLSPGVYKIRLEKDGYDPATRDVTVTAGNELEVALNLDSNTGGIDLVTVPCYITIYLDGKMVGTSEPDPANPGMSKLLSLRNLSMGKHVVTIAHKRARPEKRSFSVEIKKGEVKRLPNLTLWIPNVKLTLKSGLTRVGRLASNLKEEIMFEPEPGVKQSYKKAAISDIEYLKANE